MRYNSRVMQRLFFFALLGFLLEGPGTVGVVRAGPEGGLPEKLKEVGLDQRLDTQVPLDLAFFDEAGRKVSLRDYFGEKPVLLTLVYYRCPMLCNLVLNGTVTALRSLSFDAGQEFQVVTVSIDPRETPELAAAKKQGYLQRYGRPEAATGWHFLTGQELEIRQLADAVGFRYSYDAETGQYAHAAGIMLLTPEGRLSRYFYGVEYDPRDLRFGIIEASHNRIGTVVDQLLLFCYHYDPLTGKYGVLVMRVLRIAGVATVLALGALVIVLLRRERTAARA